MAPSPPIAAPPSRAATCTSSQPNGGVVAQRTVQVGQQVAAGTPLMAVVPLDRLWVDANFPRDPAQGPAHRQPATITADIYGGKIVYHVQGRRLGAGSGNAFRCCRRQNASGNWIKIVQRVPVSIGLNANELRQNPLRVGLSATVTVDTADQNGPRIGTAATQVDSTSGTDGKDPAIEARIAQIIAANR